LSNNNYYIMDGVVFRCFGEIGWEVEWINVEMPYHRYILTYTIKWKI